MTGIYGFMPHTIDDGGAASLSVVLDSIQDRMQPSDHSTTTRHVTDGIAMGAMSLGDHGGVAASDKVSIAVVGDIFEAERLYQELPEEFRRDAQPSLPEILRRRFESMGVEGICGLNGIYAIAAYDSRERKLYLVVDRMGYRKLTYWRGPEGVYFGTRYTAYINRPDFKREFDPLTMYEFVRFGFPIGDGTYLKDVLRVPMGGYAECAAGAVTIRPYWHLAFDQPDMSHEACVDELAERARVAVDRRAHGRIAAQITGGLDSRMIVGYLERDHPDLDIIAGTIGTPDAVDVLYGSKLARDLGYPHTPFYLDTGFFENHAEKSVRRTEGLVINHTCWRLTIADWLRETNRTSTTHGFMSIFLRMMPEVSKLVANPGRERSLEVIRYQMKDMSEEIDFAKLFRPNVYKEVEGISDRLIENYYDEAPAECDVHRYDYIELSLRQRNFQAFTLEHFYPDTGMLAPLTDNDLVDFAARMPVTSRSGSRAYFDAIVKHLPRACHAPHSKNGVPLNPSALGKLYYRARGRLIYHVLPSLTGGRVNLAPAAAYVPYRESLTGESRAFMLGCLDHADAFADVFDVNYLRSVVQDYADGKRSGYGPAYTLNTLLLWQKLFGE